MTYSPTLGRWVQEDPIGFEAGDPNFYRFVGDNPTGNVDPTGLQGGPAMPAPGSQGGSTWRGHSKLFQPPWAPPVAGGPTTAELMDAYLRIRRALWMLQNRRKDCQSINNNPQLKPVRDNPQLYIDRLADLEKRLRSGLVNYLSQPKDVRSGWGNDKAPVFATSPVNGNTITFYNEFLKSTDHTERLRVITHEYGRLAGVDSPGVEGDPIDDKNILTWDQLIQYLNIRYDTLYPK